MAHQSYGIPAKRIAVREMMDRAVMPDGRGMRIVAGVLDLNGLGSGRPGRICLCMEWAKHQDVSKNKE